MKKSSMKPGTESNPRHHDEEQALHHGNDNSESSSPSSNFSLFGRGGGGGGMDDSSGRFYSAMTDDSSFVDSSYFYPADKNYTPRRQLTDVSESSVPMGTRRDKSKKKAPPAATAAKTTNDKKNDGKTNDNNKDSKPPESREGELVKAKRSSFATTNEFEKKAASLGLDKYSTNRKQKSSRSNGGDTECSNTDANGMDQSTRTDMDDSKRENKGYFENLAPSRGMALLLGVSFTLILVIPVVFASLRQNKDHSENTEQQPEPLVNNNNGSTIDDNGNTVVPTPQGDIQVVVNNNDGTTTTTTTTFTTTTTNPPASTSTSTPESTTVTPTSPPVLISEATIQYIQSVLHNSTLNSILNGDMNANEQQSLPAFKAYQWLLQDPQVETYPDWRIRQRFAMATFYYAFNGPQWVVTSAIAGGTQQQALQYNVHECDYWWITDNGQEQACHHDNRAMARLFISDALQQGFQGSMPEEVAMLSHLHTMHFDQLHSFGRPLTHLLTPSMRELTGLTSFRCTHCDLDRLDGANNNNDDNNIPGAPLPNDLHQYLPFLEDLDLSNSRLTGTIPTQWQFASLTSLRLTNNALEGAMPSELGILSNTLLRLSLNRNNLNDAVPSEIWSSLTSLRDFDISSNKLTGTIGTELGLWTELRHFDIKGGNRLSASGVGGGGPGRDNTVGLALPSEIGLLSNNLKWLKLGGNRLGGTLPTMELAGLTSLQVLGLLGNDLEGSMDEFLTMVVPRMSNLQHLALGGNRFQGTLPPLGIAASATNNVLMTLLDLSDNLIEGEIPSELGLLTALTELTMHSNALDGALPSELALLTALESFSVHDNDVIREVPAEFCDAAPPLNLSNYRFGWCEGREECCL